MRSSSIRAELIWRGKHLPTPGKSATLCRTDAYEGPAASTPKSGWRNRLLAGDNLALMHALLPELGGKVDLLYLDPPFLAGHDFHAPLPLPDHTVPAFRDSWTEAEYLQMLYERLHVARELLAETGSLVLHANWRTVHLARMLLDELFGAGERERAGVPGFRNEIIWGYGGGGAAKGVYRRKHDNLLWYTRSDRWKFHPQYRPYSEGTRERGLTAVKGPAYTLREEGATLETWWTDPAVQKILSPTARENRKYPTQKPEALLERLIQGHTDPGDLVADFFCGSGTTGAVAERLERRWVLADSGPQALRVARRRLAELQAERSAADQPFRAFDLFHIERDAPPTAGQAAVRLEQVGEGLARVYLEQYHPRLPEGVPLPVREHAELSPLDFVDAWSVDWEYQPPIFNHRWMTGRAAGVPALPLGSVRFPLPSGARVAVKLIDAFGGETLLPDVQNR